MWPNIVIPGRDTSGATILRTAQRITSRAQVTPREIKRRLYSIAGVFVCGVLGAIAIGIAIWADAFNTPAAQQLAVFVLLGSMGICALSVVGALKVTWGSLLYEHVQRVAVESEVMAPTALAQEGIAVWYESEFAEQVAAVVMIGAASALRIDQTAARKLAETVIHQSNIQQQMADLYCRRVAQRSGESELVRELQAAVVHAQ